MLLVKCKECNIEIQGHPTQTKSCGCPNMTTVIGDKVTAVDLTRVIMLNSNINTTQKESLTAQDLEWQEQRRKRKIRKLDFEVR
jgi:hypothetical protein